MNEAKIEQPPLDMSADFINLWLSGNDAAFEALCRAKKDEPALSITIDYIEGRVGPIAANYLKQWIEPRPPYTQKRHAAIRATDEQAKESANVFASGVKWIPA